MFADESPVESGQPISARAWQAAQTARRAVRLIAGAGVRLNTTPGGTLISFDGAAASWIPPFQVTVSGNSASVRAGLVNGIEPTIAGVPISGLDGAASPRLTWASPRLDKTGRGWIALEVTCGPAWEILGAEIVQVADLDTADGLPAATPTTSQGYAAGGAPGLPGRRARHPLAMLRRRASGLIVTWQITHFHLQHRVKAAGAATDQARHFFFPAG